MVYMFKLPPELMGKMVEIRTGTGQDDEVDSEELG